MQINKTRSCLICEKKQEKPQCTQYEFGKTGQKGQKKLFLL